MRLATWNINSIRIRTHLVEQLCREADPDIICLQETKSPDEHFPIETLKGLGFPYCAMSGMKGYNGVAILSKRPLDGVECRDWAARTDCRHIIARVPFAGLPNGIELHNMYVPAGGDIPDPLENPKFDHKLRFVDEMASWFPSAREANAPMILVGDLNIAPLETDVWSHKQLLKVVSHTPIEVEKYNAAQAALPWYDAVRHIIPPSETLYSWWSYRARDWAASDRGRRLDHVWVTEPLLGTVADARILRAARGWEKASDHVPVVVDLQEQLGLTPNKLG